MDNRQLNLVILASVFIGRFIPSPSAISPETTLDAHGQKAFDHDRTE